MPITARANRGAADARGVIGRSLAGPPLLGGRTALSQPGGFAQLEVPQLVHFGGT